jgi:NADPH-dependent ferric siderophore reductase
VTEDGAIWRDLEWNDQEKCFIAGETVTPMAVRTNMRLETALRYPYHKGEISLQKYWEQCRL